MRFMMLMISEGYEEARPGAMPDPRAVEAMMAYNRSLRQAGVLLALDGLHPLSMGARVAFSGGRPKVALGPFSGLKEALGGYWMIEVESKEDAIDWARRCPVVGDATIEIRQVQEFGDFPEDARKAAAGFPGMQRQPRRSVELEIA